MNEAPVDCKTCVPLTSTNSPRTTLYNNYTDICYTHTVAAHMKSKIESARSNHTGTHARIQCI